MEIKEKIRNLLDIRARLNGIYGDNIVWHEDRLTENGIACTIGESMTAIVYYNQYNAITVTTNFVDIEDRIVESTSEAVAWITHVVDIKGVNLSKKTMTTKLDGSHHLPEKITVADMSISDLYNISNTSIEKALSEIDYFLVALNDNAFSYNFIKKDDIILIGPKPLTYNRYITVDEFVIRPIPNGDIALYKIVLTVNEDGSSSNVSVIIAGEKDIDRLIKAIVNFMEGGVFELEDTKEKYIERKINESIVLEPDDWGIDQWRTFLDVFGLKSAQRIVLTTDGRIQVYGEEKSKSDLMEGKRNPLDPDIKREVFIKTQSPEEEMRIATKIHEQLVGNEDYIESRIVLNTSDARKDGTENEVQLTIFSDSESDPEITI